MKLSAERAVLSSSSNSARHLVSIILVTWNQKEDAIECLNSLAKVRWKEKKIILVDNGSKDATPEIVLKHHPYVHVIKAGKNLGFPAANNLGIRYALDLNCPYIFLLNTDTTVDTHIVDHLAHAMESEPRLGIAGPKMYFYNDPKRIWFAGGSTDPDTGFSKHWRYGEVDREEEGDLFVPCSFVTGAGMFVRKEVFLQIGLLDEAFFHTAEDNDLCIRAQRAGLLLAFVPKAKLWHKVGSTTGGTCRSSPHYLYYEYRNKLYLAKKHSKDFGWLKKIHITTYNIMRMGWILIMREKNPAAALAVLHGMLDFFRGYTGKH